MQIKERILEIEERIRGLGDSRINRIEIHLSELLGLIEEYEAKKRTFRSHRDLIMSLNRLARRVQRSFERGEIGEEVQRFDEALTSAREWRWKQAREAASPLIEIAGLRAERDRLVREAQRQQIARREEEAKLEQQAKRLRDLLSIRLDKESEEYMAKVEAGIDSINTGVAEVIEAAVSAGRSKDIIALFGDASIRPELGLSPAPDPEHLLDFLRENPVGEQPVHRILEYAGQSDSRLSHYVEDTKRFREAISSNLAYLERLTKVGRTCPARLEVEDGPTLSTRIPPLTALISRSSAIADIDVTSILIELRKLRREVASGRYDQALTAYMVIQSLSPEERRLIEEGLVEEELRTVENRLRN